VDAQALKTAASDDAALHAASGGSARASGLTMTARKWSTY